MKVFCLGFGLASVCFFSFGVMGQTPPPGEKPTCRPGTRPVVADGDWVCFGRRKTETEQVESQFPTPAQRPESSSSRSKSLPLKLYVDGLDELEAETYIQLLSAEMNKEILLGEEGDKSSWRIKVEFTYGASGREYQLGQQIGDEVLSDVLNRARRKLPDLSGRIGDILGDRTRRQENLDGKNRLYIFPVQMKYAAPKDLNFRPIPLVRYLVVWEVLTENPGWSSFYIISDSSTPARFCAVDAHPVGAGDDPSLALLTKFVAENWLRLPGRMLGQEVSVPPDPVKCRPPAQVK